MKLITAHRILIAAAIAFFLFYAVIVLVRHAPAAIVQAVISVGVALGLVVYYRSLARRWK